MKIDDWKKVLKDCKFSTEHTGSKGLRAISNSSNTEFRFYAEEEVKIFGKGRKFKQEIKVYFNKAQKRLTIFEAELLFFVFIMKKKPYDYAKYHECITGKRFIENINRVEVE